MTKILTFGVYDYFHLGHLRLFKQCKEHADYLIVAVQNGDYIIKFKPDADIPYILSVRYLLGLHYGRGDHRIGGGPPVLQVLPLGGED